MRILFLLSIVFAFGPTAFAEGLVSVASCRIENITPPPYFVYRASAQPVLVPDGDVELSYVDFSDPRGIWETRRVYLVLSTRKGLEGVEIGAGIPEESHDYQVRRFTSGWTTDFRGDSLNPFAGTVRCEPETRKYLFVHDRAPAVILKAALYTAESLDEKLLSQSCLMGDNQAALSDLKASARFSHGSTLRTQDGGLSFRVDKQVGCRKQSEDDSWCIEPIIEKDGREITVPPCPRSTSSPSRD